MTEPQIIIVQSPNFSSRNGHSIDCIVDHIMQGTLAGTDSWFKNPASKVSAHYGVGKHGEIHKYIPDENTYAAWHAGVVDRPTAEIVLDRPGINPNAFSAGIEHEGLSGQSLTEDQYAATLWLHQQLILAYGIPIDDYHIIAHSTINAGHAGCPGNGFPWERLFTDLGA